MNFMKFKKKNGFAGDMIMCMITVMIVGLIIVVSIDVYRQVNIAADLKAIERKYMFRLETQGSLSTEDIVSLTNDLVAIHADEGSINISGTTITAVKYGETVVLNVTGKIVGLPGHIGIKGFFDGWETKNGGIEFKIHQESTAKH